jgi:hypothetical protein
LHGVKHYQHENGLKEYFVGRKMGGSHLYGGQEFGKSTDYLKEIRFRRRYPDGHAVVGFLEAESFSEHSLSSNLK